MIRSILSVVKNTRAVGFPYCASLLNRITSQHVTSKEVFFNAGRNYSISKPNCTLGREYVSSLSQLFSIRCLGFLQPKPLKVDTVRTVTKFSRSGKRKSVKLVLQKFYRLHWGCWIRTKAGRHKKLYKKSANRRRRLQYHVFCNGRQSYLLDRMVTRYWRKPRFYVDDPYEPYHTREEYPHARMRPYQPFA